MKLSLTAQVPGKWQGKPIQIMQFPFIIGRDPSCNLRPASPIISKRHCGFVVSNGKFFIRDYDSTNGTLVNNRQIKGELELQDGDVVQIGPLTFGVIIEASTPVNKPTPLPAPKLGEKEPDPEDLAAMLLSQGKSAPIEALNQSADLSSESTVLDDKLLLPPEEAPKDNPKEDPKKAENKTQMTKGGDTSSAAKALLDKYLKRPRA